MGVCGAIKFAVDETVGRIDTSMLFVGRLIEEISDTIKIKTDNLVLEARPNEQSMPISKEITQSRADPIPFQCTRNWRGNDFVSRNCFSNGPKFI